MIRDRTITPGLINILPILVMVLVLLVDGFAFANSNTPAKKLFGAKTLPAAMEAKVHGGYTRGCISGTMAMPVDGPTWQTMRLSRNRRFAHPDLIRIVEDLSIRAKRDGWNGLLVGDMSQARGGPMLTGHRSHQIGLDADIWFTPMPNHRMSYKERENTSAISVLKRGSIYVDEKRWTPAYTKLLYHAAQYKKVERILVHPAVKKKLCDTVKTNRSWLHKIRPFWGHHYHFHLRIGCPKDSPGCKPQTATPKETGCGKPLAWWYNVALAPKKKIKKKKKKKIAKKKTKRKQRRQIRLSDLPKACIAVLNAPSKDLKAATLKIRTASFQAPNLDIPAFSASAVLRSKPIEKGKSALKNSSSKTSPIAILLGVEALAIPSPRPKR